jgi:hypothetical protein
MRKIIIYILLSALVLGVGFICYSAVFPLDAARATKQPWTVITKKVVPGGTLKYEAALCKLTDSPGTITRQAFGTESKFINQEPSTIPKGCVNTIKSVTLPLDLAVGTYYLISTVEYKINAFNTDTKHFKTEEFDVVAPDSKEAPKPNTPGGIFMPTTTQSSPTPPVISPIIPVQLSTNTNTNTTVTLPTIPSVTVPKICLPLIAICL